MAVLVFCGAANLAIGRLESRRRTVDDGLRTLGRGVVAGGGEMTVLNREIEELKFGESTTDEDVRIALSTHAAKRIDLSNTQVTDASAAYLPRLPGLESLDLGHCEITAASIPNLLKCKELKHLGLAGTQLSVSEIKELMGGLPLLSIDLSEVSLSVSELKEVLDGFQGSVALRGNQLTDQDVLELLGTAYYSLGRTFVANPDNYSGSLDLSDNPITGTYLAKTDASIVRLTLCDCPVTDAAFVAAIDPDLQELRLARTKLTDAVIPSFNTIYMLETLELGEGKITDDGLATMPVQQISRLSLNAEQFTGKCFEIWQPYLGELDLSYSGVSDRTIRSLQSLNYLPLLDLSHTKLSDAALSSLANISALRVDIRDTAITAEGLAATDFVTVQQIVVGFDQFTDEELRLIESKITVDVGGIGRHQEQP